MMFCLDRISFALKLDRQNYHALNGTTYNPNIIPTLGPEPTIVTITVLLNEIVGLNTLDQEMQMLLGKITKNVPINSLIFDSLQKFGHESLDPS